MELFRGDNLDALDALVASRPASVDLIYIDPPFATGQRFEMHEGLEKPRTRHAFDDKWSDIGAFLSALEVRFARFRELLRESGSIFVHCDWRTSHYVRCVLDGVFGSACFKNEIVWRYRRWPSKTRVLQKMHDTIFWYGKSSGHEHVFHPLYEPLAASTLQTFGTRKQVADFSSGKRRPSQLEVESPGAPLSDVWDIGVVAPIARERTGYPTQKPLALLDRIVALASNPGDTVADFFCGSGTTLVSAVRAGRHAIGCDVSGLAVHTARRRLLEAAPRGACVEVHALESPAAASACGAEGAREGALAPALEAVRFAVVDGAVVLADERNAVGEHLDAWAVDPDYDGEVFRAAWWAMTCGRGAQLERSSPRFGASSRAAVKLVDREGNERIIRID